MSDGTEFQEIQKEPQESGELAEARQQLDRATIEPEAAVEKVADIKTSEAIEAAVKETVEGAVPTADRGRETGDREVAADTAPEDGRPGTEEAAVPAADGGRETGDGEVVAGAAIGDRGPRTEGQPEADRAVRAEYARDTEAATREGTPVDLEDSFDLNAEQGKENQDASTGIPDEKVEADGSAAVTSGPNEGITLQDDRLPGQAELTNSELPLERTSPVDHLTDALDTVDDQVGDFRVPTKHPQQVEPLPDRDPSGESAQIPGDSLDLELREEQEQPSYDPTLEPELAGDTGEAPGGESNSRSESGEEAVGKTAFGEPAADPASSYSGVEMSQGGVAQDSDWNEASRAGEEMVLETSPAAISEGLTAAGEESGALTIEAVPEPELSEGSESDQLANQDIQNMLQHQQQLIGMMSQISKLLHDTENAVIRNADDGSTQTDAGGSAEGEDAAPQAEGALQEIGNQAQLEMMDLQNALQRQQQAIQMMSNISKMLEDTAMSAIRNIGGNEESTQDDSEQPGDSDRDQGTSLETVLADQSDMGDLSNLNVSLEDSMQKQGQFLMIISNILKNLDDVDQAIINNMKGAEGQEGENQESSGDALQQDLEAWEEQLSTIGDDAQLTEVDLSSFLDKQQSTIEMLSGMTKTLTDTTSVVAQKLGLTQPTTLEAISQETGTQGGSLQEELASEGSPADWQSIAMDNGIDDPRTGDAVGIIMDQPEDTEEASSSSGSDQSSETDELRDRLSNLEATRHRLEMDINSLRDFIAHTPEGQFQILLIHLPVPDGQGGYHMVPMQVPADVNGAANLLAQQEGLLNLIMSEIAQVQNQLEAEPNGSPAQAENLNQEGGAGSNWQDAAQDSEVDDPRTSSGPFQSG